MISLGVKHHGTATGDHYYSLIISPFMSLDFSWSLFSSCWQLQLNSTEPGDDTTGRLQCKEVFWWEGIQLAPPRPPLGLLGKLYTSNNKFNREIFVELNVCRVAMTQIQHILHSQQS